MRSKKRALEGNGGEVGSLKFFWLSADNKIDGFVESPISIFVNFAPLSRLYSYKLCQSRGRVTKGVF